MATSPALITSIGQLAVNVRDVPRAVAFYRDILGLELLFEAAGMAFFRCGDVRLMLSAPEEKAMVHTSVIYYKTPDLHAAAAAIRAKGIAFEREPHLIAKMPDHDLWMAFLRDSEKNLLALMCEVRPPA